MTLMNANAKAYEIAKTWIGTPYRHQGSRKNIGCDCLGLIRGIWRELYGDEPIKPPAYNRSWAEITQGEPLLEACQKWFQSATSEALEQDVPNLNGTLLVFRWHRGSAAKHLGVLAGAEHFIHAYSGQAVIRSALVPSWRRRIVARFDFPPASPPNN